MAGRANVPLGIAIILATASPAAATDPYSAAELQQCVAGMPPSGPGIGWRDLDATAPTEFEVRLGHCMKYLERLYRRQPGR